MKKRYNMMLDPENVKNLDNIRDLTSRSAYINRMIEEEVVKSRTPCAVAPTTRAGCACTESQGGPQYERECSKDL